MLCALPSTVQAQIFPPSNTWMNSTCDLQTLSQRVQLVDDSCQPGTRCGLDCIGHLFSLTDDCGAMLNMMLDGRDGTYDGQFQPMMDMVDTCNELPPNVLVGYLQQLHEQGVCPSDLLDDVATTQLDRPVCEDVWGDRCHVVSTGVMTCEIDFCDSVPTTGAPCDLAGLCDRTCSYCTDDKSPGHRLLISVVKKRLRELQMSFGACDPAMFSDQAAQVDEACCDAEGLCPDGTPTECDAKCAVVYNDFYRRCQSLLGTLSPNLVDGYDRLFSTCSHSLPAQPLLRAVALCNADACAAIDCGAHGTCISQEERGICECHDGYSGDLCDTEHRTLQPGSETVELANGWAVKCSEWRGAECVGPQVRIPAGECQQSGWWNVNWGDKPVACNMFCGLSGLDVVSTSSSTPSVDISNNPGHRLQVSSGSSDCALNLPAVGRFTSYDANQDTNWQTCCSWNMGCTCSW